MLEKINFSSSMKGEASDLEGASGGLLILYKSNQFKIITLQNAGNILLSRVCHNFSNECWFLMNIYAPNNKREQKSYWHKVKEMVQNLDIKKGIIMGDFNSPLADEEKLGGLAPDWDNK